MYRERRSGILVSVHLDGASDPESGELRLLLFLAARELVFNVAKHASVDQAGLRTVREESCVALAVTDAGHGFQGTPSGGSWSGIAESQGLAGLARRLEIAGGELVIDTSPGEGARVTVRLPAVAHRDRAASPCATAKPPAV